MRKIKSLTLFNALSFIIYAGLFYSTHFQLLNAGTVREIKSPYHSLLIPTGSVSTWFWGVICTALLIFCLYHIKMAFNHHEKYPANQDTRRVDMFFIISNLTGIGWIITTINGEIIASLLLLGFQLIMLAVIHHQLNIYTRYRRIRSTICTQVPMSIYAAWLSLLFLGGISEFFDLSSDTWNIILIGGLIFISLLVIFFRHNILFGLMMIPGLYGIILKLDMLDVENFRAINLAAWAGIWMLGLAALLKLVIDFRLKEPRVIYQRTVYD